MPYNPNDPNYQTSKSRVSSFSDFESNLDKEKDELEEIGRSELNNDSEIHQIPGNGKHKFNKVTRKIDTLSKAEIKDRLKNIETKKSNHKYKLEENAHIDINDKIAIYTKADLFDAFVAGDTEGMRTGDGVDIEEFNDWFNGNK